MKSVLFSFLLLFSTNAFSQSLPSCLPTIIKGVGTNLKIEVNDFGYALGYNCPHNKFSTSAVYRVNLYKNITSAIVAEGILVWTLGNMEDFNNFINKYTEPGGIDPVKYSQVMDLLTAVRAVVKPYPYLFTVARFGTATTRPAYAYNEITKTITSRKVADVPIGTECDCIKLGIDRGTLDPQCYVPGPEIQVAICERK